MSSLLNSTEFRTQTRRMRLHLDYDDCAFNFYSSSVAYVHVCVPTFICKKKEKCLPDDIRAIPICPQAFETDCAFVFVRAEETLKRQLFL